MDKKLQQALRAWQQGQLPIEAVVTQFIRTGQPIELLDIKETPSKIEISFFLNTDSDESIFGPWDIDERLRALIDASPVEDGWVVVNKYDILTQIPELVDIFAEVKINIADASLGLVIQEGPHISEQMTIVLPDNHNLRTAEQIVQKLMALGLNTGHLNIEQINGDGEVIHSGLTQLQSGFCGRIAVDPIAEALLQTAQAPALPFTINNIPVPAFFERMMQLIYHHAYELPERTQIISSSLGFPIWREVDSIYANHINVLIADTTAEDYLDNTKQQLMRFLVRLEFYQGDVEIFLLDFNDVLRFATGTEYTYLDSAQGQTINYQDMYSYLFEGSSAKEVLWLPPWTTASFANLNAGPEEDDPDEECLHEGSTIEMNPGEWWCQDCNRAVEGPEE